MVKVLLLVALLQCVCAEYRYKIRGPPPKPMPPRPSVPHFGSTKPFPQFFSTKGKWPLGPASGHRVVPSIRAPHLQIPQAHHYLWNGPPKRPQFQFKGPSLILPTNNLNHGFRAPVLKEQFLPSPPQAEFEYHVAPQPPVVTHITNTIDDDKGPIHTIPAPNLSPNKHQEIQHQPALHQEIQHQPLLHQEIQHQSVLHPEIQHQPALHQEIQHQPALHQEIQHQPALHQEIQHQSLLQQEALNQHLLQQAVQNQHLLHQQIPHTHVAVQQSHGYEVREPSNDYAGHNPDGVPIYYAPDPDPSLPAPKIPATTDPHSVPSNGKLPPDVQAPALQILDSSNSLSQQELFQLLHSPQQQVDSYGAPLVQQASSLYSPSNYLKHADAPDFHSFNYEEQESAPSVTVVRKSPESTVTSLHDQDPKTNTVTDYNQDNYEENNKVKSTIGTSYFTTLPSREAAETLATLAAAGSINSNLANHIKNEENRNPETEEEYVEEEEAEEEEDREESSPAQIVKPVQREPEQERTRVRPQLHRRPVVPQYDDYEQEQQEKRQQVNTNVQFGARIRPKRNK